MAGFANLDDAVLDPFRTFELNVLSTINILDFCKTHKVDQIVYASSAYATSNKGSFYGLSKLTSEKIIEEYHIKFNLNYSILRYGSVYSERKFHNNYIYNLIKKAIKDKIINHKGDGEEVREYIHASDAASRTVDVIQSKEYLNKCMILTGIERIKRKELFNMIKEISGIDIKINFDTNTNTNHYNYSPYSYQPSIAKKMISNPQIDLGQGIYSCVKEVFENDM